MQERKDGRKGVKWRVASALQLAACSSCNTPRHPLHLASNLATAAAEDGGSGLDVKIKDGEEEEEVRERWNGRDDISLAKNSAASRGCSRPTKVGCLTKGNSGSFLSLFKLKEVRKFN